ncbi:MAG: ankyrin repeat domain-containing protein [Simkaniaceae bacterium]|nr:ankyrin repeat domain-containing protein [Simkaniaceae bacterium]MCF7853040.1 ankyrin repeat domain-containing protein [Simkaniaceae bacterium]
MAAISPTSAEVVSRAIPPDGVHKLEQKVTDLCKALLDTANTETIKLLIKTCSLNQLSTALILVTEKGHEFAMRTLLDARANPNATTPYGETVLHRATYRDNVNAVRTLLGAWAYPNATDNDGDTALHFAARWSKLDVVMALLEAEAKPSATNNNGQTALHLAARNSKLDVVRALLEAGVNPNKTDNNVQTALHLAARNSKLDVVKALLEAGVNPNKTDNNVQTALHLAALGGSVDVVRALLEAGANPNATNNNRQTALHLAVQKGNMDVVRALLEAGANPNATDSDGDIALHLAVQKGYMDIIRALLEAEANPNATDSQEHTALHLAVLEGNVDVVRVLLGAGADIYKRARGRQPLDLALICDKGAPVIGELLRHGAFDKAERECTPLILLINDTDSIDHYHRCINQLEKLQAFLSNLPRDYVNERLLLPEICCVVRSMPKEEDKIEAAAKPIAAFIRKHTLTESSLFLERMRKINPSLLPPLREAFNMVQNWKRRKQIIQWRRAVECSARKETPDQWRETRIRVVQDSKKWVKKEAPTCCVCS